MSNTQNYWVLSYHTYTGKKGRPAHHKGIYTSKEAALHCIRNVVRYYRIDNITLTNLPSAQY